MPGCVGPTLRITPGISSGPTVGDLVDHIACEVGKDYEEHTDPSGAAGLSGNKLVEWNYRQQLWRHFYTESFVGAVDLTLMVTDSDSAGFSYGWITPLTGNGKSAKPYVYSGQGSTSGTYNRTLALGLQLSGTQDRNVEQDYNLDVRSIIDEYEAATIDLKHANDPQFPYCARRKSGPSLVRRMESSLQGNLALPETIEDGLIALDRSSTYNIYGANGPSRLVDVLPPQPQPQPAHALAAGPSSLGTGGGGSGAVTSSGKASFASKVDFYLTSGVGGGPTFTLLLSKLSTSAGGGGSGGASGGGAGGSQPLNFSRMTQDSFTVTFAATCKLPDKEARIRANFVIMTDAPQVAGGLATIRGLTVYGSTSDLSDQDGVYDFAFTISNPTVLGTSWLSYLRKGAGQVLASAPIAFSSQSDQFVLEAPLSHSVVGIGTINWAGFVDGKGHYNLRGVVNSSMTGNVIGQIWLSGETKDLLKGVVKTSLPGNLIEQIWPTRETQSPAWPKTSTLEIEHLPYYLRSHLTDDSPDKNYWSTIPGCDAITAGQIQNIQDDVSNKTLLQSYLRQ